MHLHYYTDDYINIIFIETQVLFDGVLFPSFLLRQSLPL